MLLRINLEDAGTANALESCANAVTQLAATDRIAIDEPFIEQSRRWSDPAPTSSADGVMRSMAIATRARCHVVATRG